MTVKDNIVKTLRIVKKTAVKKAEEIAEKVLETVGLADKKDNFPNELSGGQKQRVAIARGLALEPDILLFDEPTSALDPELVKEVLDIIRKLKKERKMTMLIVSHEMKFVREISDEVIVMENGKILEKGSVDGIYINTAGVGVVPDYVQLGTSHIESGMKVIISGTLGDHAIAVMGTRYGLDLPDTIQTDCAPLHKMAHSLLETFGKNIAFFRDPTRGGLATTLQEIANSAQKGIRLQESAIPVREEVQAVCQVLGYDPLYLANEGKMIAIVSADVADDVVQMMQTFTEGREAVIIGDVVGKSTEMKAKITELQQKIKGIAGEIKPGQTAMFGASRENTLDVHTGSTFAGGLLTELGFKVPDNTGGKDIYDIDLEHVLAMNPDWMFIAHYRQESVVRKWAQQPLWKALTVTKKDQLISVDPELWARSRGLTAAALMVEQVKAAVEKKR